MTAVKLETELRAGAFEGDVITTYDGLLPFAVHEYVDVRRPDDPEDDGLYQVAQVRTRVDAGLTLRVVVLVRLRS